MVIPVPARSHGRSGPRPINLNRDVPQVLALLESVFGRNLVSGRGRRSGVGSEQDWQPALMWRLNPGVGKLSLGYVWEEDDKIVGNATVLKTASSHRYLVVNVAVHPDFRRRGIARLLMAEVTEMVRGRQGREISLQVEKENSEALGLYRSLRYHEIGTVTTWGVSASRLREIPATTADLGEPHIRELRRREWREAYDLDTTAQSPDLNWPEALQVDAYRSGFWRNLNRFLSGIRTETWVIADDEERLMGLGNIRGELTRPYTASVRVHANGRGLLERPLLAKIIRRLRHMPDRDVRFEHVDDDEQMSQLLLEARFQPRRTLTHMRLTL